MCVVLQYCLVNRTCETVYSGFLPEGTIQHSVPPRTHTCTSPHIKNGVVKHHWPLRGVFVNVNVYVCAWVSGACVCVPSSSLPHPLPRTTSASTMTVNIHCQHAFTEPSTLLHSLSTLYYTFLFFDYCHTCTRKKRVYRVFFLKRNRNPTKKTPRCNNSYLARRD